MLMRAPEWLKNKTLCLAWPHHEDLWGENLIPAQEEFLALVAALKGQSLLILFASQDAFDKHKAHFTGFDGLKMRVEPYGDIWLRDTLPIFVKNESSKVFAVMPRFNGWGQKYLFDDDKDLSLRIADYFSAEKIYSSLVFEGGAVEHNGEGLAITTEHCLLNSNRNPQTSKAQVEQEFSKLFGTKKTIWLKNGLKNDHTDSHVDTIARFIAPNKVAIMKAADNSDVNFAVLRQIKEDLSNSRNLFDEPLDLVELPSPGCITNAEHEIMPASYVNFIIGDEVVVVPTYGSPFDQEAVDILGEHFDMPVIGLSARAILSGGGAFHCISQEIFR